jgi:hypothetical protein
MLHGYSINIPSTLCHFIDKISGEMDQKLPETVDSRNFAAMIIGHAFRTHVPHIPHGTNYLTGEEYSNG